MNRSMQWTAGSTLGILAIEHTAFAQTGRTQRRRSESHSIEPHTNVSRPFGGQQGHEVQPRPIFRNNERPNPVVGKIAPSVERHAPRRRALRPKTASEAVGCGLPMRETHGADKFAEAGSHQSKGS